MNLACAIFYTMGHHEQAKDLLIEALETADALNDLNAQAGALAMLISIYFARGEFGRAQIAAERIEQVAHRIGDPVHLRFAYQQMAATLLTRGRSREAQQYLERLLRSPAAPGDPRDAIITIPTTIGRTGRRWLRRFGCRVSRNRRSTRLALAWKNCEAQITHSCFVGHCTASAAC